MDEKNKNELLLKLMLVLVRDRKAMQGRIRSVGYTREYGELPHDMYVYTLGKLQEDELLALADSIGVRKMLPVGAKSDIYMNDVGYAIYNFAKDQPILIDGLTRDRMTALCSQAGVSIGKLDARIGEYWSLRGSGAIGEQAANRDPASPFKSDREWLAPLLTYYLFEGSETGPSMFPAECVLDYAEPLNTNSWSIYEPEETIDVIWEKLVFTVKEPPAAAEAGEADGGDAWSAPGSKTRAALYIQVGE